MPASGDIVRSRRIQDNPPLRGNSDELICEQLLAAQALAGTDSDHRPDEGDRSVENRLADCVGLTNATNAVRGSVSSSAFSQRKVASRRSEG